jgi:hypothetical protein
MISISIDVTLLDKSRFKEVIRQNGKKAIFCDLILIETPEGKYGDYMVKQSQSKEDRAARVETPILGNGKIVGRQQAQASKPPTTESAAPAETDDVPF